MRFYAVIFFFPLNDSSFHTSANVTPNNLEDPHAMIAYSNSSSNKVNDLTDRVQLERSGKKPGLVRDSRFRIFTVKFSCE